MKVLVADAFEQSGLAGLKAAGCEVIHQPDLADQTLADAVHRTAADVLVVRGTPVREAAIAAGGLSLIVRAGAGYNTIDVAAASKRGVYVSNCPGRNAAAVAELTFGLILALDRRIPDNVIDLRAGKWNKKEYSRARGLYGRTLGILGYGTIGQEVAARARSFGMEILVWSRRFQEGIGAGGAQGPGLALPPIAASPREVASRADILTLHLALTSATRGLVDAAVIDRLRPGASVINTARAELVDAQALARAVRERAIRVGLDVFATEPAGSTGEIQDPLLALPGVYGTHHIGASTDQAQEAIAAETVRIITIYRDTGRVLNVVNLAKTTPATHRLIVRHRDRPGVLAHVFDHLRAAQINVQEIENVIFDGAEAAVARIDLDGPPPVELLDAIRRENSDIIDLHLVTT